MGDEKYPTVGSSGESWSMNESLNQHYAEDERPVRVVKATRVVKSVHGRKKLTLRLLEPRAKEVPAAAVIPRRGSVTSPYWA